MPVHIEIASCLAKSEDARMRERKGWLLSTAGYLSSLGHSRLDYFEKVRGIEGFI